MTISRGQMERQLRMGGGIMDIVPREPAIFGGIKKAVKKVGKTVGKIAKSDIGKAALGAAALYYAPKIGIKAQGGLPAFLQGTKTGIQNFLLGTPVGSDVGGNIRSGGLFSKFGKALGIGAGAGKGSGLLTKGLALAGLTTFLTDQFGMSEEQVEETLANPESRATYLRRYYQNLNPNAGDEEVEEFVAANVAEYMAEGGRIGFATGESGIMKMASAILGDESDALAIQLFGKPVKELNPAEMEELQMEIERLMNKFRAEGPVLPPDTTQPVNPFGPKPGDFGIEEDIPIKTASYGYNEAMADTYDSYLEMKKKGLIPPTMDFDEFLQEVVPEMSKKQDMDRTMAAVGGKMDTASDNAMQAAGIEGLPIRQNPKGIKELDLRDTGGFIPPVGIKEKEDDIPAMLSNNEFVFTADAVRGMGGGDVNKGAQMLYDQMKMLEAGGKV